MAQNSPQQQPQENPSRINTVNAVLMICTAVLLGIIGLIPVVGQYFSLVGAIVIFGIWFIILGVPLISPKKVISTALNFLAEAFPAVGEFWIGITAGVILIIVLTKIEDKTGVSVLDKVGAGKLSPKDLGATLNKGVRRMENPERTLQARERLQRMNERKATPKPTNKPSMQDFVEKS